MKAEITILLAAYNGEKFVGQMIDSVLAQDYNEIKLVVSDDGSTDRTQDILAEYAEKHPDKIVHYRSGRRFGSAQKHFMHLLSAFYDAPYIMFCDQDDVWHSDKISKTLAKMRETELGGAPTLVHSDLRVVDEDLRETSPSFCKQMKIRGKEKAFNRLLVQNVATGCTMMLNRKLAELVVKSCDEEAIAMHDWWIALLASAFGNIGFLDEATIDYRQHGNNSVGAKDVRSLEFVKTSIKTKKMKKSLTLALAQAKLLEKLYGEELEEKKRKVLAAFLSTEGRCLFKRDFVYVRYKLLKRGFLKTLAQLLDI